jgi:hypothetical protein
VADSQPVRKQDAGESADEELLREIREDYTYYRDFWRDNHNEMKTDLRFISGDPWEPDDRRNREDNNRPVLCPDELSQYQNATINNLRQNKRAIQVNPKGSGATDKDAERRSAIIKGIEYKSNAQGAYTNAFENQINCGMGFFRITTKVVDKKSGDQEPRIKDIENPLSVLLDPNAKEPDFSDMKRCFVMDILRKRDFGKQYPKAKMSSFAADDMSTAPDWFQGENILVAEYWRIDGYDPETGEGGKVTQYVTNGVEILSRTPWIGSWIPIISAMGKKVYVPHGSEMKRYYYSQIRLARGPQMMLAYGASHEAEVVGMLPRVPMMGYVGQFETDKEAWDSLNTIPRAYIQVDPVVDEGGGGVLPLPTRAQFGPDIAGYEAFNERWRRAIQAAMGITPLPTAAQRQNEKSGIALEKIQSQQAIGSFHFTDNFDRAIENCGRQLDELITLVMDTAREVTGRKADDTHDVMHVVPGGTPLPQAEPGQPPITGDDILDPKRGDFDVTISSGMSYQSQREQASDFVDTLIQNLDSLPLSPQSKATLLARAISLKDIGPIGDDLAKIIDPQGDGMPVPPQAQQMIAQLQQQLQLLQQANVQYQTKVSELEFEKKAGMVKGQNDIILKKMQIEADLAVAEIETKSQVLGERIEFVHDLVKQLIGQAHESGMAAQNAQQTQDLTAQQGQQQSDLQSQAQEADNGDQSDSSAQAGQG